ncbi:MAG: PadR family transcriptional regulator [Gemmatimonadota bacterium]
MDVRQGTLDLLVLRTLAEEPAHGWAIAQRIEMLSEDALRLNQGSLYPALHKLEDGGYISGKWGIAEDTRRRVKVYSLTARGRSRLSAEEADWRAYVQAMELVLGGQP